MNWISVIDREPKKAQWYRVIWCGKTSKLKWKKEIGVVGKRYEPGYFHENKKKCKRPCRVTHWRESK